MEKYYEVLRPARRSNSLPGSLRNEYQKSCLPDALFEVLAEDFCRQRQQSLEPSGHSDSQTFEEENKGEISPEDVANDRKDEFSNEITPHRKENEKEFPIGNDEITVVASQPRVAQPEKEEENELSEPTIVPFDPNQIITWMHNYRFVNSYCPPNIAAFATRIKATIRQEAESDKTKTVGGGSPSSPFARNSGPGDRNGVFGVKSRASLSNSNYAGNGSDYEFGGASERPTVNVLEAIGALWEDRKDMPIAVGSRQHGLFGSTKKELHQMVTAVLNKVTDDRSKFLEVKNELLRLPIPEAKPDQLDKIVNVFFTKAVREPHFCHTYVDLISILCKVPEGQRISGDKTRSLEYRLRQALVKRCQTQFMSDVEEERNPVEPSNTTSEELASIMKERRDRMCGTARFVAELYLQGIIKENVIYYIIASSAAGINTQFCIPPTYVPVESQMDVIITTVKFLKERFFMDSVDGKNLLIPLTACLDYWKDHYEVNRCRFLLLSVVENLKKMLLIVHPPRNPSLVPPTCLDEIHIPEERSLLVKEAPKAAVAAAQSSGKKNNLSKPFNLVLSAAISKTKSPDLQNCLAEPTKINVQSENVANLMKSYRTGQMNTQQLASHTKETYGNVLPVFQIWITRCLSVVREEKVRLQTGKVLAQLVLDCPSEESRQQLRECIRKLALQCFIDVMEKKIYENFRVFKFWAELILSDAHRAVLDEEQLNDGLRLVVDSYPQVSRQYLADVGAYYSSRVGEDGSNAEGKEPFEASSEETGFVRYRPLLMLHLKENVSKQFVLEEVNTPSVTTASLEAEVFVSLCSSAASVAVDGFNADSLFEKMRTSPRLASDPTLAAELLSAVLFAELVNPSRKAFLEDCMSVLQIAVDGKDRSSREALLLAEVYAILQHSPQSLSFSASSRIVSKLLVAEVLSDETVARLNAFFGSETDGEKDSKAICLSETKPVQRNERDTDANHQRDDSSIPTGSHLNHSKHKAKKKSGSGAYNPQQKQVTGKQMNSSESSVTSGNTSSHHRSNYHNNNNNKHNSVNRDEGGKRYNNSRKYSEEDYYSNNGNRSKMRGDSFDRGSGSDSTRKNSSSIMSPSSVAIAEEYKNRYAPRSAASKKLSVSAGGSSASYENNYHNTNKHGDSAQKSKRHYKN